MKSSGWILAIGAFLCFSCGVARSEKEGTAQRTTQSLCAVDCSPYACDDGAESCYDWCKNDAYCAPGALCVDDVCIGNTAEGGDCTLYQPDPSGTGCLTYCYRDSDCTETAYCDQGTERCRRNLCIDAPVNDANACTIDQCARETGLVTHTNQPAGAYCPDETACNGIEKCDGQGHLQCPRHCACHRRRQPLHGR